MMARARPESVRMSPDRMFREILQQTDNLRAFLRSAIPDIAEHLSVDQAEVQSPLFSLDDWRYRETDLLFSIPLSEEDIRYRVMILIEHQTQTDRLMPLRTLLGAANFWERQWKEHEDAPTPRGTMELDPVIPIVLYTGSSVWGSTTTIRDLIRAPANLQERIPNWGPIIWNLASLSVEDLLDSDDVWMNMMAVIRAQEEELEVFR